MGLSHLTDEQIQDYLDGNLPDCEVVIRSHIENCDSCLQKLDNYRFLYNSLSRIPQPELPVGFAGRVTEKVLSGRQSGEQLIGWGRLALILSFAGCIAGSIILLDWSSLWNFATTSLRSSTASLVRICLSSDLAGAGLNPTLLLLAFFVLAVMIIMDRLLMRPLKEPSADNRH
jgi:anti-sigma factor RsiW